MKKFGYTPSNGNYRSINIVDFFQTPKLTLAAAVNNASCHIIDTSRIPVLNQLELSCCASISTSVACQIVRCVQNPQANYQPLSYLFTYYCARNAEKSIGLDAGSFIADNLESLRILGACELSLWNDHSRVFDTPGILAFKQANSNKISSFHRIVKGQGFLDDIDISLRANRPIVFGTAVSQEFCDYSGQGKVFSFPSKQNTVGMHAMIIIGVRENNSKREYLLRNSWGLGWGQGGNCWIDQDYIRNSSDFFVVEAFPDLLV